MKRQKKFVARQDKSFHIVCNDRIRATQVRLIQEGQESMVCATSEAQRIAKEQGLDLIVVSGNAEPPVCKIMELNKFLYQQRQKEKHQAKQARASAVELKEMRFGLNIDEHDINTKIKKVQEMLDKGATVTLTVVLKGRERSQRSFAKDMLISVAEKLEVELDSISQSYNRVSAKIR